MSQTWLDPSRWQETKPWPGSTATAPHRIHTQPHPTRPRTYLPQRHALLRNQHAVIGRQLARDVREQGEVQPAEAAGPVTCVAVWFVWLVGLIELNERQRCSQRPSHVLAGRFAPGEVAVAGVHGDAQDFGVEVLYIMNVMVGIGHDGNWQP